MQGGSSALATGVGQATATIGTVDPTRSVAFGSFQSGSGQNLGRTTYALDDLVGVGAATLAVTSPTQITIDRANTADAADIGWFVVDFGG